MAYHLDKDGQGSKANQECDVDIGSANSTSREWQIGGRGQNTATNGAGRDRTSSAYSSAIRRKLQTYEALRRGRNARINAGSRGSNCAEGEGRDATSPCGHGDILVLHYSRQVRSHGVSRNYSHGDRSDTRTGMTINR